jgi:4-hydroxy-tetrahydrodipicolinate synthase
VTGRYEEALDVYRWYTPLLHMDSHPKLVQYIKLAAAECGLGTETVRAPRLPLVEPERSEILTVIRRAIETRPSATCVEAPRPKSEFVSKARVSAPGGPTR